MKRTRKISNIIAQAVSILLIFTACNNDGTVIHCYRNISTKGWNKWDTVTIPVDSLAESGTYMFDVEVRNSGNYPYRSLWLIVEREFEHPHLYRKDTVECELFTETSDKSGKGIFIYQNSYPLPPMNLGKGQHGHISIRHFMIKESVPCISDIGIRMYK